MGTRLVARVAVRFTFFGCLFVACGGEPDTKFGHGDLLPNVPLPPPVGHGGGGAGAGADAGGDGGESDGGVGGGADGTDGSGSVDTWSYLYATYFSPSAIGACGDPTRNCHATPGNGGFTAGTTKDTCYAGFTAYSGGPGALKAYLVWYGGNMPLGVDPSSIGDTTKATVTGEIDAWIAAGATND